MTSTPPTPVSRYRGREPFAILNLTWVVAIAASLFVLGKIYSVAGLSPDAAMAILRSTNILQVLLGSMLSDIQALSIVVLLLVLALFLHAEWPLHGRNEREVGLLRAVLLVAWLMAVALAPWPIAAVVLLIGTSLIASQTGPLHYLAHKRALGWLGKWGRRLQAGYDEQQERSEFHRSLPEPVVAALERGDVDEALGQLTDPPPYAKAEFEELARSYSPTTGIPPLHRGLARLAVFLIAVTVFGGLTLPRPWVPAERITLKSGSAQTGYVLGTDNDRLTVLWASSRKVEFVDASDVVSRTICQGTGRYRTLPQLLRDPVVKVSNYPHCNK